jgi:hypothetical protein
MKVRRKDVFEAIQVTEALKNEPGQPFIRNLIGGVTQVELFPSRISVSTRYANYDLSVGDWILKDSKGAISKIRELDFKMNYEIV